MSQHGTRWPVGHGGFDAAVWPAEGELAAASQSGCHRRAIDVARLENTGTGLFTAITATGALAASQFWIGAAAHAATDRIIYDLAAGKLFYDADGTGAAAKVLFANITAGLTMTAADFMVI